MTEYKIISMHNLEAEMRAVARGERVAPPYAGTQTFESVGALMRFLTRENRRLLAMIRDRKPQSIPELAEMSGRPVPEIAQALQELEAVGFVTMEGTESRKVPTATVHRLRIEIDPFSQNDVVEMA